MNATPLRIALPFEPDHPAFAGHFPSMPIIPGVQLLDRALLLIESNSGIRLQGVQAAKFLSPAGPGDALELEYQIGDRLVSFDIHCGQRKIASGQFMRHPPQS